MSNRKRETDDEKDRRVPSFCEKERMFFMKRFYEKKLAAAILVGLSVSFAETGFAAPLDNASTKVDVQVTVQQTEGPAGIIDWYKDTGSEIVATGVGLPNRMGTGGMYMARRAAVTDAYRNLAELINGVQVDSDTTMRDLMIESDVVHTKTSGLIYGAKIIDEGRNADGSYYVKMTIPLFGQNSVAAAALPEVTKNIQKEAYPPAAVTLPQQEIKAIRNASYTGVIIDAGGLELQPTFSPAIYDVNGRIIYGIKNIDPDFAISKGMVGYAKSVQDAYSIARIGAKPLVIRAVAAKGGASSVNKVNVVVSAEDGDKILLANEKSGMLDQCAVVLVR